VIIASRLFALCLISTVCWPFRAEASNTNDCSSLPETGFLCRLAPGSSITDNLPPRALGAISAFVAAKIDGADLAKGTVELKLFTLLPAEVQKQCTNSAKNAASTELGAAVLCLRPNCLEEATTQRCRALILALPEHNNVEELRKIERTLMKACSKPDTCILSAEALELVVAADLLNRFVTEKITSSWLDVCPEDPRAKETIAACTRRLADIVTHISQMYAIGAAWHAAITQLKSNANVPGASSLARLPETQKFESSWDSVQRAVGKLQKPEEYGTLFMLAPALQPELAKAAAASNDLSIAVAGLVDSERFKVASKAAEALKVFFSTTSPGNVEFDKLKQRFSEPSIAQRLSSRSDPQWRTAAKTVQDITAAADVLKRQFLLDAQKSLLGSESQACASGNSRIDQNAGIIDYCYPVSGKADGIKIVGLRFNFAPCRSTVVECATDGDIQLLSRLGDTATVARSLGLDQVKSLISFGSDANPPSVRLRVRAPYLAYTRKSEQLAATIRQLFPAPLVARVEAADVSDGPTVRLELTIGLDLKGMGDLVRFAFKLTQHGITQDDGVALPDIMQIVQTKVLNAAVGRQTQIGVLELSVTSASALDGCPGALNFSVGAKAKLFGDLPPADVEIKSCAGKFSVALKANQTALISALEAKIRTFASNVQGAAKIQLDNNAVALYVADNRLHAVAKLSAATCVSTLDIDLTNDIGAQLTQTAINQLKDCALEAVTSAVTFQVGGIGFAAVPQKPGVYCSNPIPTIGKFCITGVNPPFSPVRGELQNDGEALKSVTNSLNGILGKNAVVKSIQLDNGQIVVVASTSFPGLGDLDNLKFAITNKGISGSFDQALHDAVKAKIETIVGKRVSIGGIEIQNVSVANGPGLALTGEVSYGGFSAPIRVDLLPTFKIQPQKPDIGTALKAIQQVLGFVSNIKEIQLVTSADGSPAVRAEVQVAVPILGSDQFAAAAVLEAKAGGNLRFAGPVSITLPIPWIPLSYVAIGKIRSRVDLNDLKDISIGASLTLAPGEGTYEIVGLDGDLHVEPSSVDLNASLAIISIPLAQSKGQWRFKEGMLEIDVGTTSLPDIIPLPSGHMVVDGRACAVAGSAGVQLLGAKILSAKAGVFLGAACNAGDPRSSLIIELISKCGPRGPLGQICLSGDASFGFINGSGFFSSRLDQITPTITGEIVLAGLANFSVAINSSAAKLSTRVFGFRLGVVLPTVEGLNEDFLKQLIANLLKPTINLEALLRGEIVIAPASKSGNGDDAMASADSKDGGAKPGDPGTKASDQKPPSTKGDQKPSLPAGPPVPGGDYKGPAGTIKLGVRQFNSTPYWQVVMVDKGNESPWLPYLFSKADAEDLRSGASVLFGGDIHESSDGSRALLACHPYGCALNAIHAINVYQSTEPNATLPSSKIFEIEPGIASIQTSDTGFFAVNPAPRQLFAFPALIDFAATRSQSKDGEPASVICFSKEGKDCVTGLLKMGTGRALLHRGWWHLVPISNESIAKPFIEQACPKECNDGKVSALLQFDDASFFALKQGPTTGIALRRSYSFPAFDVKTTLQMFNSTDLSVTKTWPISSAAPSIPYFGFWDASIKRPLLEDLLADVAAKAKDGTSIELSTKNEKFAAAIANDNTSTRIWSAIQQDGKSCVRSKPLDEINQVVTAWSQKGFVDPGYAKTIVLPNRHDLLIGSLSDPALRANEFNISPLLLFGDLAASCK
jgi:hypothetical protein